MRQGKKKPTFDILSALGVFEKAEGDTTMKNKKKCHINSSG